MPVLWRVQFAQRWCCNLTGGVALIVWFTTNGMCAKNKNICMWRDQAIIEWSLLLLAATVRSFAHMPLGISDRNSGLSQYKHQPNPSSKRTSFDSWHIYMEDHLHLFFTTTQFNSCTVHFSTWVSSGSQPLFGRGTLQLIFLHAAHQSQWLKCPL